MADEVNITSVFINIGDAHPFHYISRILETYIKDDEKNKSLVVLQARGRNISNAVTVASIIRDRYIVNMTYDFEIGTELIKDKKVTFIKIALQRHTVQEEVEPNV